MTIWLSHDGHVVSGLVGTIGANQGLNRRCRNFSVAAEEISCDRPCQMLQTGPRALVQKNLHGRQPVGNGIGYHV